MYHGVYNIRRRCTATTAERLGEKTRKSAAVNYLHDTVYSHLKANCDKLKMHSRKAKYMRSNNSDSLGLPWWCRGCESACQRRGHGSDPWSGKISHAVEELSA